MAKAVKNKQQSKGRRSDAKRVEGKKAEAKKTAKGRPDKGRPAKPTPRQPRERKGFMKFLRDVRVEMSKVTWPTRSDLTQSTIVVIVAVAIAAAYTFVLDEVFMTVLDFVLPK